MTKGHAPLRRFILVIAGCAMLAGCGWPPAGLGGFAEHRLIEEPGILAYDQRIGALKERGAEHYAAAELLEAELLLNRVKRESRGGLLEDAHRNAGRLHIRLSAMEARLPRHPPRHINPYKRGV